MISSVVIQCLLHSMTLIVMTIIEGEEEGRKENEEMIGREEEDGTGFAAWQACHAWET